MRLPAAALVVLLAACTSNDPPIVNVTVLGATSATSSATSTSTSATSGTGGAGGSVAASSVATTSSAGPGGGGGAGGATAGSGGDGGEGGCTPIADACGSNVAGSCAPADDGCGNAIDCDAYACFPDPTAVHMGCDHVTWECVCQDASGFPQAVAACDGVNLSLPSFCADVANVNVPVACAPTGIHIAPDGWEVFCCGP